MSPIWSHDSLHGARRSSSVTALSICAAVHPALILGAARLTSAAAGPVSRETRPDYPRWLVGSLQVSQGAHETPAQHAAPTSCSINRCIKPSLPGAALLDQTCHPQAIQILPFTLSILSRSSNIVCLATRRSNTLYWRIVVFMTGFPQLKPLVSVTVGPRIVLRRNRIVKSRRCIASSFGR